MNDVHTGYALLPPQIVHELECRDPGKHGEEESQAG